MSKKYQVFVSSTYTDLKEERQKAMEALLDSDCIPAGMEWFPAADEEQLEFIKKVIDNCDYYLLIIGDRYGSVAQDGISYTEKEYDYALSLGLKIIGLIKNSSVNSDLEDSQRLRLEEFKSKVSSGRLVSFWDDAKDVQLKTFKAISHAKANYPATGWMRADKASNTVLLEELNELRKENQALKQSVQEYKNNEPTAIDGLAELEDKYKVKGTYDHLRYGRQPWEFEGSWAQLFALVAPALIHSIHDNGLKPAFSKAISSSAGITSGDLSTSDFDTLKIQFKALGLIYYAEHNLVNGGVGLFWKLTDKGEKLMVQLRTVKK
ncbi:MAG: DUF4062 domain-containing protein [Rickettsiales bacterium]|nr:DUF4062 domain-containing protein [Rickettsiales bacterium]